MAEQFQRPQQKIEPIEEVKPRHPVDTVKEGDAIASPDKVKFDQALERADPTKANLQIRQPTVEEAAKVPEKPSLLEIAKQPTKVPTSETLLSSATDLQKRFQAPQAYLMSYQQKQIEIPAEFAKEMNARIEHMDKSLVDVKKLSSGVEVSSAVESSSSSPAVRFLHFLTDADKRMSTIVSDINTYTAKGQKLSPEKLLAIQIKLNYVQQELEFFTNILNRSIESIKTLMNVQI